MTDPQALIAEALGKHRIVGPVGGLLAKCDCGDSVDDHAAHQAAVIAALPGIAIVETPRLIETLDEALDLADGSILMDGIEQPWAIFMLEDAVEQFGATQVQKNFPMTLIRAAADEGEY